MVIDSDQLLPSPKGLRLHALMLSLVRELFYFHCHGNHLIVFISGRAAESNKPYPAFIHHSMKGRNTRLDRVNCGEWDGLHDCHVFIGRLLD